MKTEKLPTEKELRTIYEETIVNLISSTKYVDLSFYGFIIAKCRVNFDPKFPTCGVHFRDNNFQLTIGGGFADWTLQERIAVLIHETRHILGLHMFRKGERDHQLFNVAADVAINQLIQNLPEGAQFP
jgi:hypothetical protein